MYVRYELKAGVKVGSTPDSYSKILPTFREPCQPEVRGGTRKGETETDTALNCSYQDNVNSTHCLGKIWLGKLVSNV